MSEIEKTCGFVCIIGAGPGDAGLLTLKAKRFLELADVVVYDRLVSPSVLAFVRPDAELIYAGKTPDGEGVSQDWVNEILVSKALEGKFVVRLKNGDPFVFGRGAEEIEALVNAGIPFEIVPGVSSAFAVPAYAGIPLTDRRLSSSFVVTVGRNSPLTENGKRASLNQLVKADTVVILMGVGELDKVVRKILEGGKSPETPSAIIEWGTTSRQKVVVAPLGDLVANAKAKGIAPPAVLVVGDVVRMREKLAWYERKPLFGKRVAVTCLDEQDDEIAFRLETLGAEVVRLHFLKPVNENRLCYSYRVDKDSLLSCSWLIFACPHSVRAFLHWMRQAGLDLRTFARTKIAAVGKRTFEALTRFCITPDITLGESESPNSVTDLLFGEEMCEGKDYLSFSIWHGCQNLIELANWLKNLEAKVYEVELGCNEIEPIIQNLLKRLLKDPVDLFVFTNPCAVFKLAQSIETLSLGEAMFVALGEDTGLALRQLGFSPTIFASADEFGILFKSPILAPLLAP